MPDALPGSSIEWASSPFEKETANIILRSSDGVHFRVRKGILAEASVVFDDMFSHAKPSTSASLTCGEETLDGVPIISMEETGAVLDCILRLCYPPYQSKVSRLTEEGLVAAMDATRKYFMDFAYKALLDRFQEVAEEGRATFMYSIACRRRWADEMSIAAKASLKQSWQNEPMEELKYITGLDYCHLLRYRDRCTKAVLAVAQDARFTWRSSAFGATDVPGAVIPAYLKQGRRLGHTFPTHYMAPVLSQLSIRPHSQVVLETSLSLKLYRIAFEAGLHDEVQLKDAIDTYEKEFSGAIDAAISAVSTVVLSFALSLKPELGHGQVELEIA